jgi:hypothetical protein
MTLNAPLTITRWISPVASVAALGVAALLANGGEHVANVTSARSAFTEA